MSEAKSNIDAASPDLPVGSALVKEAELWIGAQGDLLTGIENVMTGWMRRQREAIETSSRSMRKMCDARNVFDLLQAQNEWVSDCLHWTASEIRAVSSDTTTLTRRTTERFSERSERLQESRPAFEVTPSRSPERVAAE
ncbi:MAG TPA: hypothetical protein VE687_07380 [Stellaceae bacterium]|nr:hypothetical protein [Stellaceae bacterium]